MRHVMLLLFVGILITITSLYTVSGRAPLKLLYIKVCPADPLFLESVQITVGVANTSSSSENGLLRVSIDGRTMDQSLLLMPGENSEYSFSFKLGMSSSYCIKVELIKNGILLAKFENVLTPKGWLRSFTSSDSWTYSTTLGVRNDEYLGTLAPPWRSSVVSANTFVGRTSTKTIYRYYRLEQDGVWFVGERRLKGATEEKTIKLREPIRIFDFPQLRTGGTASVREILFDTGDPTGSGKIWGGILVPVSASASSSHGGDNENRAIDRKIDTLWRSLPGQSMNWIMFSLGSLRILDGLRVYWPSDENWRPHSFIIQVSTDNVSWETVCEAYARPSAGWSEYFFQPRAVQYMRIVSFYQLGICEVEYYCPLTATLSIENTCLENVDPFGECIAFDYTLTISGIGRTWGSYKMFGGVITIPFSDREATVNVRRDGRMWYSRRYGLVKDMILSESWTSDPVNITETDTITLQSTNIIPQTAIFHVTMEKIPTSLVVTPTSFSTKPGENVIVSATLRDAYGNPLISKNIKWSVDPVCGTLVPENALTDGSGIASVTFVLSLPDVTEFKVIASFGGDQEYLEARAVAVGRLFTPSQTTMTIIPSDFSVFSSQSLRFFCTLLDMNGKPVPNRAIVWEISAGSLDTYVTTTDSLGMASVFYTAPIVMAETTVTVRASFRGDNKYNPCSTVVQGKVFPSTKVLTNLALFVPSEMTVGTSTTILAKLLDSRGNPLANKILRWVSTGGTFSQEKTVTNEKGESSVTFISPTIDQRSSVVVMVYFQGDENYESSQASANITVLPRTLTDIKENLISTLNRLAFSIEKLSTAIDMLSQSISEGRVGCSISISINIHTNQVVTSKEFEKDVRVEPARVKKGELELRVFSNIKEGRTIVVNIEESVLRRAEKYVVLFDGIPIPQADDLEDVLDPSNDIFPEYLVLMGGKGIQLLVSIPSFSVHTIVVKSPIAEAGSLAPLLIATNLVVVVLVLLFVFRRSRVR